MERQNPFLQTAQASALPVACWWSVSSILPEAHFGVQKDTSSISVYLEVNYFGINQELSCSSWDVRPLFSPSWCLEQCWMRWGGVPRAVHGPDWRQLKFAVVSALVWSHFSPWPSQTEKHLRIFINTHFPTLCCCWTREQVGSSAINIFRL